jgi:hypothetical protein
MFTRKKKLAKTPRLLLKSIIRRKTVQTLMFVALTFFGSAIEPVYENHDQYETRESSEQNSRYHEKNDDLPMELECESAGTGC